MEIYDSARKHGVDDSDIQHAVDHALVIADSDDDKVLYLGPDRAGTCSRLLRSSETMRPRS